MSGAHTQGRLFRLLNLREKRSRSAGGCFRRPHSTQAVAAKARPAYENSTHHRQGVEGAPCILLASKGILPRPGFDSAQSSRTMASVSGSPDPELSKLFQSFYESYPEEYRENVWYLTLTSALTALGSPSLTGPLFTHVIQQNPGLSPAKVSNRIRECLLKIFTLVGVAPVLTAFFALAEAERAASLDRDIKTEAQGEILHDDMALNKENYDRGGEFLRMLYQQSLEPIVEKMGRHGGEIMHMERHIIYGLYLANFKVLSPKETELVCFPALLCSGTRGPGEWHIRGSRRVGVEWGDIWKVTECLSMLADWVLGPESTESGSRGRQEIVPGKGRSEWVRWAEGVQKGMEAEDSA